jgi:F-type H+-transporting ATPase subunit a
VPVGTPTLLLPLMVIIESISILIRPLTLAIRLVANIIAGHLLLSLVGRKIAIAVAVIPTYAVQTGLVLLELAVAAIQSYVFVVLLTLYSKEASGPPP